MKVLDLFSGIGGFHLGMKKAGLKFDWVGFSEVDKYASSVYKRRFPDAKELGDIRNVRPERDLPNKIDVLCGGFPCQTFSIAGNRQAFEDTRGTLFFEIARILKYYRQINRPIKYFILENVKGLYSASDYSVLPTIYGVLTDLNYSVECQLLNTRWVLPQNRERIYIVGHTREGSGQEIFPIGETDFKHQKLEKSGESNEQYCKTITARGAGEYHSGMQLVNTGLKQVGTVGKDSEASRVYDPKGIARTIKNGGGMGAKTGLYLDTGNTQAVKIKKINIIGNLKGEDGHECHNVHSTDGIAPTVRNNHGKITMVQPTSSIRRLTPKECERLQGFPDDWTSEGIIDGEVVKISDTQRYKQCGNAVTVDIVQMVVKKIFKDIIYD